MKIDELAELLLPYITPAPSGKEDCVFLDEIQRCSIYETRPIICRTFPFALRRDEDKDWLLIWSDSCQSYEISSDEAAFRRLFGEAIQYYNEKLKGLVLLMRAREQLRDLGFGIYLRSE